MVNFKNYTIFCCDFETTFHKEWNDDNLYASIIGDDVVNNLYDPISPAQDSQVFLAGTMLLNSENYFLTFENLIDYFDILAQQTFLEKKTKCVVFFHNLTYDGSYILHWLLNNGYKQSIKINDKTLEAKVGYKEFNCLINNGKYFSLKLKWKGITINFLDSLKLFPQTLESLGEIVGFKKLKETVDYKKFKIYKNHKYPKEWLAYLKRDCLILTKLLKQLFEKEKITLKKYTIGSVSYSHIKKIIKENCYQLNVKEYQDWLPFFNGGMCFPSFKYQAKWVYKPNQIKMIDAVSMYPSQMVKPLPTGHFSSIILPNWNSYTCYLKVLIKQATIKKYFNDIAIIPTPYIYNQFQKKERVMVDELGEQIIKSNHHYQTHLSNCVIFVVKDEWELFQKIYDITFEIIDVKYCETKPYLKEVIETLFLEKKANAASDKKVETLLSKLKLNNLYGKTAQNPNRLQDFYGPKENVPKNYEIVGKKNTKYEGYNIREILDPEKDAAPVYLASYITALARVSLINKYLEIILAGGTFLYCDTDSIAFIDTPTPIKLKNIGVELGDWNYEKDKHKKPISGDGFISLCPKHYRLVKVGQQEPLKLACAGVKKDIMKLVKNQDYNFKLDENKLYKITKTSLKNGKFGKIIIETAFSFKKWKNYFKEIKIPKELINE